MDASQEAKALVKEAKEQAKEMNHAEGKEHIARAEEEAQRLKDLHKPIGLVDGETGEVLFDNFNAHQAQVAGYVQPRGDSTWRSKKQQEEDSLLSLRKSKANKSGGGKGEGGSGAARGATPFRGRMSFKYIDVPPELYYLYVLSMAKFDGFDDTPESFARWLTYCIFKLHTLFPEAFGLDKFLLAAAQGGGLNYDH